MKNYGQVIAQLSEMPLEDDDQGEVARHVPMNPEMYEKFLEQHAKLKGAKKIILIKQPGTDDYETYDQDAFTVIKESTSASYTLPYIVFTGYLRNITGIIIPYNWLNANLYMLGVKGYMFILDNSLDNSTRRVDGVEEEKLMPDIMIFYPKDEELSGHGEISVSKLEEMGKKLLREFEYY